MRRPVEVLWGANFETPIRGPWKIDRQNPPALSNRDWLVPSGFIDAQGNRSTDLREGCTKGENLTQCLQSNGVQASSIAYHPEDRFWTFQWIATAIYLAFSALAPCSPVWLVV